MKTYNKPIKVCMIVPNHWSFVEGGAQNQVKNLLDHAISSGGSKVYVICERSSQSYVPENYTLISRYRTPGNDSQVTSLSLKNKISVLLFILLSLIIIRPNVIYQRVGCGLTGIAGLYSFIFRSKFVWNVAHDDDLSPSVSDKSTFYSGSRIDKALLMVGRRLADYIVTQTSEQFHRAKQAMPNAGIILVPNFHPQPKDEIKPRSVLRVIWVANFRPEKNPELFIRLAKDYLNIDSRVQFTMIGSQSSNSAWQNSLLLAIGECQNLTYLGGLPASVTNAYIANSDVFVNTSLSEGFPNTFIQAWLRSVPVISAFVDPDGILGKGVGGYIAGESCALLDHVRRLLEDADLRATLAATGKAHAQANHSMRNAVRLLDLLVPSP